MVTRSWSFYFVTSKCFDCMQNYVIAAGAVRARSGKGLDYCYMIGREANTCLLGHATGILFRL